MKDWLEKNNKLITGGLVLFIAIGGLVLLYQQQQDKVTAKQNSLKTEQQNWKREKDEMSEQMNDLQKQIADLKTQKSNSPAPVVNSGTVLGATSSSTENSGMVNINTADATALDGLPGIGPAKAKAIIDYRTGKGGFKNISEIKNVKGIGDATFQKLKSKITI